MSDNAKPFIEKLLGSNWRTSMWAIISGVAGFVAAYPELLSPMPDYWEDLMKKALAFLVAGGVIKLGLASSDKVKSQEVSKGIKEEMEKIKYEKF